MADPKDPTVEEIRQRYAHYGPDENVKRNTAVAHIRRLLAEIDRLRGD